MNRQRRRVLWLSLAGTLIALIVLSAIAYEIHTRVRGRESRGMTMMAAWQERTAEMPTADAEARWEAIRGEVESSLPFAHPAQLAVPYEVLAARYAAEGRYVEALARHERVLTMRGEEFDAYGAFLAGLAGDVDRLRAIAEGVPQDDRGFLEVFAAANLAWYERDYDRVLELTADGSWVTGLPRPRGDKAEKEWMVLLRLKSLVRLCRYEEAYGQIPEVDFSMLPDMISRTGKYVRTCFVLVFAKVGEGLGEFEDTVALCNKILPRLETKGPWGNLRRQFVEIRERVKRKQKSAAQSRPATSPAIRPQGTSRDIGVSTLGLRGHGATGSGFKY